MVVCEQVYRTRGATPVSLRLPLARPANQRLPVDRPAAAAGLLEFRIHPYRPLGLRTRALRRALRYSKRERPHGRPCGRPPISRPRTGCQQVAWTPRPGRHFCFFEINPCFSSTGTMSLETAAARVRLLTDSSVRNVPDQMRCPLAPVAQTSV